MSVMSELTSAFLLLIAMAALVVIIVRENISMLDALAAWAAARAWGLRCERAEYAKRTQV